MMDNDTDMHLGLRAKHKLDTKNKIQQAATALFAEYGFQATTTDMIATAVDISPRTLFRYFESKEDLLLAKIISSLDEITDILRKRPSSESCLEAFRESVIEVLTQRNTALATILANAVGEIGMERTTSRLITNLRSWEEGIANAFCERLGLPGGLWSVKYTGENGAISSEEYKTYIDKIDNVKLLAAIGTTIFRSVFTSAKNYSDIKDYSNWVEAKLRAAFDFLESGCAV